jgi:hypothetical protein
MIFGESRGEKTLEIFSDAKRRLANDGQRRVAAAAHEKPALPLTGKAGAAMTGNRKPAGG